LSFVGKGARAGRRRLKPLGKGNLLPEKKKVTISVVPKERGKNRVTRGLIQHADGPKHKKNLLGSEGRFEGK